jgi:molybdopterin molybdotransferase
MLGVEEARARLLAETVPLAPETVPLIEARGRWLAEAVAARITQPPFAASAMDGYAIRWSDRAGPWTLIGEAAAGRGFAGSVAPGQTVRIFTGAPMPKGTDTVVVQEDVAAKGAAVRLTGDGPPRRGAHVRAAAQDFKAGALLAEAGSRVTPARIGLFAAAGHGTVAVRRRPSVALLATGDELVPPGALPARDQIVSANGVMLTSLLEGVGAQVDDLGIVADRQEAIETALRRGAEADLLVTIGGASVGDHDLVQPALRAMGAAIDFWKVAMRPGKPMLAGRLGTTRVIGLPGNPVSAFVTATLFVVPLLRQLAGAALVEPEVHHGRLATALPANGDRRDHIRAVARPLADGWLLDPAPVQDSAMLQILAASNALIVRPRGAPAAAVGDPVSFLLIDSAEDVA